MAPPGITLVGVKDEQKKKKKKKENKLPKPHVQKGITQVPVLRHIQALSTERPLETKREPWRDSRGGRCPERLDSGSLTCCPHRSPGHPVNSGSDSVCVLQGGERGQVLRWHFSNKLPPATIRCWPTDHHVRG